MKLNPLLRYSCQFKDCGCEVRSQLIRAPGKVKQGRVMMESYVCQNCQDKMCSTINTFFDNKRCGDMTCCNKCGCSFGTEGPYYAHRRPVDQQTWKTVPVCKDCFKNYCDCCRSVAGGS